MARTATRTAPAAPAAAPARRGVRISVGALFENASGSRTIRLEADFLSMLGMEVDESKEYSLVLNPRTSSGGREYTSLFLAIEDA